MLEKVTSPGASCSPVAARSSTVASAAAAAASPSPPAPAVSGRRMGLGRGGAAAARNTLAKCVRFAQRYTPTLSVWHVPTKSPDGDMDRDVTARSNWSQSMSRPDGTSYIRTVQSADADSSHLAPPRPVSRRVPKSTPGPARARDPRAVRPGARLGSGTRD